jgi:hypothetical protein
MITVSKFLFIFATSKRECWIMENNVVTTSSPVIARFWPELNELNDNMKLELIIMLSRSMRHHNASKGSAHWADRFCGVWEDSRTADEIVDDIRSMRTTNTFDIGL